MMRFEFLVSYAVSFVMISATVFRSIASPSVLTVYYQDFWPEPSFVAGSASLNHMAQWEQYEIWTVVDGKWELRSAFASFAVASAVASNYAYRMRLIHVVYEGSTRVSEDVVMELGATRAKP